MRKIKKIGKLSRRYARALLSAVLRERGNEGEPTPAQQIAASLNRFAAVWRDDPQLAQYCLSPMFAKESRQNAFIEVAKATGIDETGLRFLNVLFQHDRAAGLPEVAQSFVELADTAAGIVPVEVVAARQLSGEEAAEVEAQIRTGISGRPVFTWHVDPEILGGVIIRYEGKVVDGSVRGRLERIEKELR